MSHIAWNEHPGKSIRSSGDQQERIPETGILQETQSFFPEQVLGITALNSSAVLHVGRI